VADSITLLWHGNSSLLLLFVSQQQSKDLPSTSQPFLLRNLLYLCNNATKEYNSPVDFRERGELGISSGHIGHQVKNEMVLIKKWGICRK
ncbi:MAG: hypothetical protein AAGA27_02155, partial [Pseudomonadota bacterium]